jgi:hypothetical protein
MMWLTALAIVLFAVSVVALGMSGAEPPHRIQTFGHSSPEERAFEHRATRLRTIGFVSIALAVMLGVVIVLQLLE